MVQRAAGPLRGSRSAEDADPPAAARAAGRASDQATSRSSVQIGDGACRLSGRTRALTAVQQRLDALLGRRMRAEQRPSDRRPKTA